MPFFLITAMTLFATVVFLWTIAATQHTNLYSLRNLFLAVWFYYGFSVGIDLITGVEIPYLAGEAYMMDPSNWPAVAFVMWCYVLCGVAFLITYAVMQGSDRITPIPLKYDLRLPPEWGLILLHCVAAWVYSEWFLGMDRMARISMAQMHVSYKFATLVVPLTLAMDIIVILSAENRKALTTISLALLLALLTGNRSYVIVFFLVAAFRWRPALRGWKLAGIVGSSLLVVFAFKTIYMVGITWWQGTRIDAAMVFDYLHLSLSGLDAGASYSIAIFYTGEESPWWLGKSYVHTPLMLTWPRFLGGSHVSTLAEEYVWNYHTQMAQRGGAMAFSAIAEAWLNFSYIGPVLLGIFWGAVANFLDRRPRGMAYIIAMLMITRLFRSDAASLFKNWVLVWGLMFVIAMMLLTVYTVIVDAERKRTVAATRNNGPAANQGEA